MDTKAKFKLAAIVEKLDEWLDTYDETEVDAETWEKVNKAYHELEDLTEE